MKWLFLVSFAFVATSIGVADARIKCNENYQVVQGNEISTPYCRDNYLATIARAQGVKVTDEDIRNSPARKSEVCRLVGQDNGVHIACGDSRRNRD